MSSKAETSHSIFPQKNSERLARSLPTHSSFGLPAYIAVSQAAPFLDFARNDTIMLKSLLARSVRLLANAKRSFNPSRISGRHSAAEDSGSYNASLKPVLFISCRAN